MSSEGCGAIVIFFTLLLYPITSSVERMKRQRTGAEHILNCNSTKRRRERELSVCNGRNGFMPEFPNICLPTNSNLLLPVVRRLNAKTTRNKEFKRQSWSPTLILPAEAEGETLKAIILFTTVSTHGTKLVTKFPEYVVTLGNLK